MKQQSSFAERLTRIETQTTVGGAPAHRSNDRVQKKTPKLRMYRHMIAAGAIAGGIIGALFSMRFGLILLAGVDLPTLYQLVLEDYTKAALLAGVMIAPVGLILSLIFARGNQKGWQFWVGYTVAVLSANRSDIESYYYIVTSAAS